MVIEYARSVAGLDGASSSEFDPGAPHPVIATMEEQKAIVAGDGDLGGTMRLGCLPGGAGRGHRWCARCTAPTGSASGTGTATRSTTPTASSWRRPGLVFSGDVAGPLAGRVRRAAPRGAPVLRGHPGAPGVPVPPDRAHPLFAGLVGAALDRQRAERLLDVETAAAPA